MKCIVTGGAGFIGSHLCEALLDRGDRVVCFDNFNNYYPPEYKRKNVETFIEHPNFILIEGDIRDQDLVNNTFEYHKPTHVAHLAAMAGPRPSVEKPLLYEEVNYGGTLKLLEAAKQFPIQGFVLASTSSVYGRAPTPWHEDISTSRPLSPYAATKKAAEVLAYTYHSLFKIPIRVARFFTVYGPKGRPDMTPRLFLDAMRRGDPITLYNGGHGVYRDWTYVDDIIAGVLALLDSNISYDIFNLGNSDPVELIAFVRALERITGLEARIIEKPLPAADPTKTFADTTKAMNILGFKPTMPLEEGLQHFWEWYQQEPESSLHQ